VHESIGGGGQISVSTSATSSSSSSSSNKDHRVDDTPIEYTSFGGPAQNNNTVKSRAEQMTAHRRVRINLNLPFFSLFLFGSFGEEIFLKLNFWVVLLFLSEFFFGRYARSSLLLHSVVVVREQIRTSWSMRIVQRYVMFM
jgi:hypothetical protein